MALRTELGKFHACFVADIADRALSTLNLDFVRGVSASWALYRGSHTCCAEVASRTFVRHVFTCACRTVVSGGTRILGRFKSSVKTNLTCSA